MADPGALREGDLTDPRDYFDRHVPDAIVRRGDLSGVLGDIEAVAQVHVEGELGGIWHFVIQAGQVRVASGAHAAADFTVKLTAATFRRLRAKEVAPKTAFMKGHVKITGSMSTAMRIAALLR